ncbi:glycoside hydrolase family 2 protein [Aaosphaeria arxii CBS 175.79]|uniref:Glycoside hydrolase family 2 protein n=1 Tax=Aaosphaeria arxii CBS 175.79 TaxID=1450172 RepID=A0A6A5Y4E7_9PLEO|nr:glycoside hydrolase family 2 protein [Aaosphaeria arxii CBS 175.79]KAF2020422.1 glycoside hydrolase family 2 protein [Aaosphaeria arxii CBS 175.79]
MVNPDTTTYPRPDFERSGLNWKSLNGPWDFLFDDEDAGLLSNWHRNGLPERVEVGGSQESDSTTGKDGETITQKIAALPENLLKDNDFTAGANSYSKSKIIVPFVFQTAASGVHDLNAHEVIWYERTVTDVRTAQEKENQNRVLLRFGAVDYDATIWIDGFYVGGHRGGHVPFDLDITESLKPDGSSRLTIRVKDAVYDLTQPRGKQYWAAKPESIFYTPSSGIWQSVWLESVPAARIADPSHGTTLRSDDIENGKLKGRVQVSGRRSGQKLSVEIEASLGGVVVGSEKKALGRENDGVDLTLSMRLSSDKVSQLEKSFLEKAPLDNDCYWLNSVALWSPTQPTLYELTIRLYDHSDKLIDTVRTQTGMRSIRWRDTNNRLLLNNKPLFQALCLDQGYWPETGMTPPSPESLKVDIELSKKLGFNGCRKHQKVEDPIFLYYADKLGYLVWGEMANAYQFSAEYMSRFDQEWIESVKRDINHPSIIIWTPVNETWGYPSLKDSKDQQDHIKSLVFATKSLDPTRPINDNCGWEHVYDDLTTFHDYADAPELTQTCSKLENILGEHAGRNVFVGGASHRKDAPVICTEFGGVNIKPGSAGDAGERDWGYTTASDPEDLLKRVRGLAMGVVSSGIISGFVYTQLTDIEQEVNGLYTFDRKPKLDVDKVRAIMEEAAKVYLSSLEK